MMDLTKDGGLVEAEEKLKFCTYFCKHSSREGHVSILEFLVFSAVV